MVKKIQFNSNTAHTLITRRIFSTFRMKHSTQSTRSAQTMFEWMMSDDKYIQAKQIISEKLFRCEYVSTPTFRPFGFLFFYFFFFHLSIVGFIERINFFFSLRDNSNNHIRAVDGKKKSILCLQSSLVKLDHLEQIRAYAEFYRSKTIFAIQNRNFSNFVFGNFRCRCCRIFLEINL